MDFDFSPEQLAFVDEVERFLDEHDDPEVFDLTRENMAQIVDTPKRRAFMAEVRGPRSGRAFQKCQEGESPFFAPRYTVMTNLER